MQLREGAIELGITNAEIKKVARRLRIKFKTANSSVTQAQFDKIKAQVAKSETANDTAVPGEAEVLDFDGRTGKGRIRVSDASGKGDFDFDLRQTAITNTKYSPLIPGEKIQAVVEGDTVRSIETLS